ncbi:MAG: CpsD/CapB family tyrosine-protein kinase [Clostridiales bacterium]|nr:CpsD/CapB family tyrosine-protein kinase [Clostridiales bacterium]
MAKKSLLKNLDELQEAIVVTNNSFSYANECFNRLKDNLLLYMDGGRKKVISMQSSVSNELKTTVTCNLAVSLGYSDKKVLVIDLDFRRPSVHRAFSVTNKTGIVEIMLEKSTFTDAVQKTEYENVDVLTRGDKVYNPSFILTSERFFSLIEEAKKVYDVILLDTAPVLEVSDYIHLSKITDGSIFLVAYGSTKKSMVKESVNEIKKNGIEIISVVCTKCPKKMVDGKYHRYYGYYTSNEK